MEPAGERDAPGNESADYQCSPDRRSNGKRGYARILGSCNRDEVRNYRGEIEPLGYGILLEFGEQFCFQSYHFSSSNFFSVLLNPFG
jgi:hypothetical protein